MILSKYMLNIATNYLKANKIDFIVAGVQKAGTSALDSYLRTHPEVCMAMRKELHFFDRDMFFKVLPNYIIYHSFFAKKTEHKVMGEATPIYSYWDSCPERIYSYNPNMKLIVVLRNPIARAYSHWNMEKQRGDEPLDFLDAVNNESLRCREELPRQHRLFSYIDRGFYVSQIRRLWRFFSPNQVLIIKHEDLLLDPNSEMEKVWLFLGVSKRQIKERTVHARKYDSKMTEEEFNILKEIFYLEIKQIEAMLDWDCTDWLRYE